MSVSETQPGNASATINITVNGAARTCLAKSTIAVFLHELGIAAAGTAVAVNDAVVPRSQHATCEIHADDRLEILHAVAGG
jgi:sulfur carrier protein